MPIYEYQCDSCTGRFEIKQGIKDAPLTVCPKCGNRVQRLISSPAIMFKGSGWYVTDYSDKLKPPSDDTVPAPAAGDKKETTPSTSDQTTSSSPSPPSSPSSTPASTPSSTTSSTPSTAATAPPSSTAK